MSALPSIETQVYSAAEEARAFFTDASVDGILAQCQSGELDWREALDDFLGGIAQKGREMAGPTR